MISALILMIAPSSFYIIFFSIMALQTALLTATGIRHGILNELDSKKKEIKEGAFSTSTFGKVSTPEIREVFCSRIDVAKKDCTFRVVWVTTVFKMSIFLFIIQIFAVLFFHEILTTTFISSILVGLMGSSLFLLLINALLFASLITLTNALDKKFEDDIYGLAWKIGLKKLIRSSK